MLLTAILKRINIKNSDTDSYVTISLELNNNGLDLNYLNSLKHREILINIIDNEEVRI